MNSILFIKFESDRRPDRSVLIVTPVFRIVGVRTLLERIVFKAATLTFHALHGTAPPYMTSQFTRVADMSN